MDRSAHALRFALTRTITKIELFTKNSCDHCSSYNLSNTPAVPNRDSFLALKGILKVKGKILLCRSEQITYFKLLINIIGFQLSCCELMLGVSVSQ